MYGQHSWLQDPVRSWVLFITKKFYMAQSGISKLNHLLLNAINGIFEISTIKERNYLCITNCSFGVTTNIDYLLYNITR